MPQNKLFESAGLHVPEDVAPYWRPTTKRPHRVRVIRVEPGAEKELPAKGNRPAQKVKVLARLTVELGGPSDQADPNATWPTRTWEITSKQLYAQVYKAADAPRAELDVGVSGTGTNTVYTVERVHAAPGVAEDVANLNGGGDDA